MVGFVITRNPGGDTFDGSECTGTDGNASRTLTVPFAVKDNSLIFVGGRILFLTDDWTHDGSVITFLVRVDNTDKILVRE